MEVEWTLGALLHSLLGATTPAKQVTRVWVGGRDGVGSYGGDDDWRCTFGADGCSPCYLTFLLQA